MDCPHCGKNTKFCGGKKISDFETHFWYQCLDVMCGHTFVCSMSLLRTIRRPEKLINPAVFDVVESTGAESRRITMAIKAALG